MKSVNKRERLIDPQMQAFAEPKKRGVGVCVHFLPTVMGFYVHFLSTATENEPKERRTRGRGGVHFLSAAKENEPKERRIRWRGS